MKVILSLILFIAVVLGASDLVYRTVHYPDNYGIDRTGAMYVTSHNLMYSVVIYSNGSIFTVGNSTTSAYISDVNYAYSSRVIRHFKVDASYIEKFKSYVQESGFLNLPLAKEENKSNKICDNFYSSRFSQHKVCRPEDTNHFTIEGIYNEIQNLINSAYSSDFNYRPPNYFAETKMVSYYDIIGKGPIIRKTNRMMLQEFDPDSKFMASDYTVSAYIFNRYNYKSYNMFWEAGNNGSIYTDDLKYFQVIVYVDGLSVNEHPPAVNPSFYSSSTGSYSYGYPVSSNSFPWTIVFFGFLFIFFTVFIIFIIRRRLRNNSFNQDDNISVEDKSSSNEYEQPMTQPTSYPIFVQSNNPQMTTYPIFVTTNPQMQTNGVPIIFPQPQVFYPMQTNQINPQ